MTGKWANSNRRARLPANWETEIRPRVLHRAGGRCEHTLRGQRCPHPATDVDHIHRGDDHRDSNLRALCDWHHRQKSSREGVDARATLKAKLRRPAERHPGLID
jgi:hypothetical protein